MPRYFAYFNENDKYVAITGNDCHHIKNVLRMKSGDDLIISNETKAFYGIIKSIEPEKVVVELQYELKQNSELPIYVAIAQGMPKADKFETVIQKTTELGVREIIPVLSERSLIKVDAKSGGKKLERFEKIAKSASEQSQRLVIPKVKQFMTLTELIKYSKNFNVKCIAYEASTNEEQSNLPNILQKMKPDDSLLVFIGPEGGIAEKELSLLKENGFIVISLGNRILRTETAPLFVMSAIVYEFELRKPLTE